MKNRGWIWIATFLLVLSGCDPNGEGPGTQQVNVIDTEYGSIQFDFPLDDKYGAGRCTKRTDLSISFTADSLYRKEFLTCANLSDFQGKYTFNLKPGKYFYQAGKACFCKGDTCLWNDYPGGQMGVQWKMGWFTIAAGKSIGERITFD